MAYGIDYLGWSNFSKSFISTTRHPKSKRRFQQYDNNRGRRRKHNSDFWQIKSISDQRKCVINRTAARVNEFQNSKKKTNKNRTTKFYYIYDGFRLNQFVRNTDMSHWWESSNHIYSEYTVIMKTRSLRMRDYTHSRSRAHTRACVICVHASKSSGDVRGMPLSRHRNIAARRCTTLVWIHYYVFRAFLIGLSLLSVWQTRNDNHDENNKFILLYFVKKNVFPQIKS